MVARDAKEAIADLDAGERASPQHTAQHGKQADYNRLRQKCRLFGF